ncbi:IQ domain-containing protein K [Dipodomys spectabilis]|uniref:IQ domain-containing protein K n=1 Tax=Dipodomys spectabilis TaxID=105255 RepID=UPI001C541CC2|nr:IQ domain-containing protein K [Dipodomys spectabilis]
MVALWSVSARSALREKSGVSPEPSVTAPTPPAPLEQPVPPGQVAEPPPPPPPPERNLWEQICEEYEAELPSFLECKVKPEAAVPVSPLEELVFPSIRAEHLVPAAQTPVDSHVPCPQKELVTLDPKTCSPKEYLENFIFPVLLSGMVSLLHQAKIEKCFERKRTKFIACDYLTEWLYNHNPKRTGETFTEFFSIPFVEEWLKNHPRPPIPLSLLLTEEEAAISIQAFWRAYLVRCDPEIQELRQWQKKLREDKHIRQRVQMFWAKQEQKVKCKMEDEENYLLSAAQKGPVADKL